MSDRVSKKGLLDGNLFEEEYIDKRSYFVIVYRDRKKFCISKRPWPKAIYAIKVRLHWRDFACDFALACTFSKENK
jgi:hypothetical protein